MPTKKILTPLLPEQVYHIYNRGNDRENLFITHANYCYFMRKYWHLLGDFVDTYAYCLIPNHFHFLIRVKKSDDNFYHLKVSHQFRRLFQSYALAINKQEDRTGSLFRKHFRRIQVDNMDYLKRLVFYIHFNPQKHQVIQNFRKYSYSSYPYYVKGFRRNLLKRDETISWFNDIEDFIHYHDELHDERKLRDVNLEDD